MADKLLQGPFCGGEASIYHGDDTGEYIKGTRYVMAFCGWCGASIRRKNEEEVIKKWNNRPSPWHTGTPTEEGWYLLHTKISIDKPYCVAYMDGRHWLGINDFFIMTDDVIEWQKINEEEKNNG